MALNPGPWKVKGIVQDPGIATGESLLLSLGIVTVSSRTPPEPWGTYDDTAMTARRISPSMAGRLSYNSSTKELRCDLDGVTGASWTAAEGGGSVEPPPTTDLEEANFFELRRGRSTITYTPHDFAGEPVVVYNHRGQTRTFRGNDEVRLEQTELGTLVTVTLEVKPDLETRLLTLVLPQVQVNGTTPEQFSAPVIFTRVEMSIAGLPLHPGPVHTYDMKIYSGTASFIVP